MPRAQRPDGVEIAWSAHGDGPPVVIANLGYSHPSVLQGLIGELSRDHRALVYHPRGTGESTHRGPYEIPVDAEDLIAVLEDAEVTGAVAVGNGDGADRVLLAARQRPDLIDAVVVTGNLAIKGGNEGLSSSGEVLKALVTLLETDYRAGLHAMFGPGNPELDEAGRQERVEMTVAHCDQDAAVSRIRSWIAHDPIPDARAVGESLWILGFETNPWFTGAERARDLLPDAHHRQVADGPMTRPDLTAEAVRALTRTEAR